MAALRRLAVLLVASAVSAAGLVVPARADVSYFCLSVQRFPPVGPRYEVRGLMCHGSGTTDVTITGGGTLVTHLCHTATLSGTTLTGEDCRQASG
ncbi:hypothetical protein ACIBKY_37420 [Nonomuraea sp. NPDC050394]|uniref:hypothetical protein n=1 Tax=Nonomuraea sp. NPDC050394 TaxID=3364363 RepID=UPI0037B498E4